MRKSLNTIRPPRTRTLTKTMALTRTMARTTIPIRRKVDTVVGRRYEAISLNTLRHHPGLEI